MRKVTTLKIDENGKEIWVQTEEEDAPIIERPLQEIEAENKLKEEIIRDALMLKGKDYKDNIISFTKEDGDGVMQVKIAFEMGLQETVIHFKCGTKLPMKVQDFNEFALWFIQERNKFFIGEHSEN